MQSGDVGSSASEELASVVAALEREVLGVQTPRLRSVPPYSSSKGHEAIQVAEAFGIVLDPWQKQTLIDGCATRDDGKWVAFEVAGEVPRQNGKGGIIEPRELAAIFAWGERLVVHSAHEFPTATEAMVRMEDILAGTPEYSAQVKSVSRSHGSEGFIFKSGQRLRYRTRTKGGGRGFSIRETLILDEAMILQDAFIGALLPTLSAQSVTGNPQVWYFGSAVDQQVHEYGVVFARLRARALRGDDPSLAYFGWSGAPAVDDDRVPVTPEHPMVADLLDDARTWAASNPALGIRISEEHVANERRSMGAREFAVERLGIGDWPDVDAGDSPIAIATWDALADALSKLLDPVAFAFDVSPDRAAASISAGGLRSDALSHVEVVASERGTGWVVRRAIELNSKHRPIAWLCDAAGPAAALIPELEEAGIEVTPISAAEHARACGMLFDYVEQERLRHLGQDELRAALRGAAKRPLGDAWAWSRKNSAVNITSLVSATLALYGARTIEPEPEPAEPMWAFS